MWHSPFPMVVMIVAIVMFAGVMRARYAHQARSSNPADDPEARRLREEVKALRDRVAVLERIATDRAVALDHEIERLRDS